MSQSDRYKSAYDQWLAQREEQERQPEAPGEFVGSPRNFLPPDQRRTFVVPNGVPGIGADDPFPNRVTADQRRQQQAALAHDIERATRLSGSSHVAPSARESMRSGYRPVLQRDAVGRLYTSWQKLDGTEEIS